MITENVHIINNSIKEICKNCGRNFEEIVLIAVSKTKSIELIKEAYDVGIINFGENKAQDLRDKSKLIKGSFNWHFLGHLQKNKVKYVVETADYIHSVDSLQIASEINNRALQKGLIKRILIEVNASGEETKFGLSNYHSVERLINECSELENIEVKGLMTMAPFTTDEVLIRKTFEKLREMKEKINRSNKDITELSMGMTNDYKIAIEEGSTMLRIGTAIFGGRDSSKNWREL